VSGTGRWSTQAKVGLILLVLGVVAAAVLLALSIPDGAPLNPSGSSAPTSSASTDQVAGAALGERIFQTGTDENGRLIPRSGARGMMGSAVACANCHGADARGRSIQMMMRQIESADIRWSALTAPPADPEEEAFDPDSFFLAVTQGIEPEGGALKAFMPRWDLTRAQTDALIEYLKTR
jgi:mono/diheme cytochrome c family protein